MKRFESFENNIKEPWPSHPTHSQLKRISLSNTDESALFNSEDWIHQYNVSLNGVHIKILWFEELLGPNNRDAFLIIGFIDGRKIDRELINWRSETFYSPRECLEAFVYGR